MPQAPRRVAILLAVPQELGPLARRLRLSRCRARGLEHRVTFQGTSAHQELLVAAGGVGPRLAACAAEALIRSWRPDLLLMAGVAGALSPHLGVGDLLVAERVATGEGILRPTRIPDCDLRHRGTLLSLDRVLVTAAEKQAAHSGTLDRLALAAPHPLAIEMETAAVAGAATRSGTAWAALRAISDAADEDLPLDFNDLRNPDGDLPTARVALAAVTRPSSIPGLVRLGGNTSRAAESLAAFLGAWLEAGAPSIAE